jgi:hypothetical protein
MIGANHATNNEETFNQGQISHSSFSGARRDP